MFILPSRTPGVDVLRPLIAFRSQLRSRPYRRGDALFELADAMLCTAGPVQSPVELSWEPEFLRRHGSVYDALHHGGVSTDRLRQAVVQRLSPARAGEPLMFAGDTTPLARHDARFAHQRTMVMVRTPCLTCPCQGSTAFCRHRLRPGTHHASSPLHERGLTEGTTFCAAHLCGSCLDADQPQRPSPPGDLSWGLFRKTSHNVTCAVASQPDSYSRRRDAGPVHTAGGHGRRVDD